MRFRFASYIPNSRGASFGPSRGIVRSISSDS
jgi:hypothetical protein